MTLQATHGCKGIFFWNGWEEKDPNYKFPRSYLGCIQENAWKGRSGNSLPGSNGREGSPSWATPRPLGARLTITLTNGS